VAVGQIIQKRDSYKMEQERSPLVLRKNNQHNSDYISKKIGMQEVLTDLHIGSANFHDGVLQEWQEENDIPSHVFYSLFHKQSPPRILLSIFSSL